MSEVTFSCVAAYLFQALRGLDTVGKFSAIFQGRQFL